MAEIRLIARLDIKGPNLIKGIQLEGVRKIGDPNEHAVRYYAEGADEILYMDAVASLYARDVLRDIIYRTAKNVFVPITAGGGIRALEDADVLLRAGADKIAVNTAAVRTPALLSQLAERFGSQAVVLQIDAKARPGGGWEPYCDGGREHSGLDVVEWARRGAALGAGEILLTSIDREGMARGFDIALTQAVSDAVSIPVIASGGMGRFEHLEAVVRDSGADAVAMAYVLHYRKETLPELRSQALARGLSVRRST